MAVCGGDDERFKKFECGLRTEGSEMVLAAAAAAAAMAEYGDPSEGVECRSGDEKERVSEAGRKQRRKDQESRPPPRHG